MEINNYKKYALLNSFVTASCLLFASSYAKAHHNFGFGYGLGSPNSLKGGRVNYQYSIKDWSRVGLLIDASYARWTNNKAGLNDLDVFAIAPFIQWRGGELHKFHPFINFSIGFAKKSSRRVGSFDCGSKWTFQDILGFGFQINKNWATHFSYIHYSNASLAPPNPGIDIMPIVSLVYRFF